MRVLFTSSPAVGHLLPILPVAAAAAAAGHDVIVGCGASLGPAVERSGLRHVALGPATLMEVRDRVEEIAASQGLPRAYLFYTEVFGNRIAAAIAYDVLALADDWRPEVIVNEDMEVGSWIVAERLGIPHVTIQATAWRPWQRPLQVPHQNELRVRHGLAPSADLDGRDGLRWFTTRPPAMRDPAHPMPAALGELRPDPDDRVGGDVDAVPPWLAAPAQRPRVAVTLGTVNSHRTDLFTAILDGLAGLEVEAVVALGADPASLGAVPPNVRVERYVPLSLLLPRSSLAVHHGGSGTTLATLAAGIPSVVVPITADQFDNAAGIVRAGAGLDLDSTALTAESVGTAVGRLLEEPPFARRATAVAAQIAAMPDAHAAWAEIESLV